MIETDVAVVGAGPAGCAAAITAAHAGRRVLLIDKASFPRDKICGDGLTTGALRLLQQLGLDPQRLPSWRSAEAIVVRSPGGAEQRFGFPAHSQGTFAAIVRRYELDAAVLELAEAAGAQLQQGNAVTNTVPAADHVELTLANGQSVRSRFVVAADGMWSPTRKHLGLASPGYRGDAHAFRQYFTNVQGRAADELYVSFEADLLPGYFWSFPMADGVVNAGFGIHRGTRYSVQEMAKVWPELLARPHIAEFLGSAALAEGPHRAWPIPARVGKLPVSGASGRVLFAGDAVAAVDPMTGEGIGQALLSGIEAAEAVAEAGPYRPLQARQRYQRFVDRELVPDHRMSRVLMAGLRHRPGAEAAVRIAATNDWTRRNFARWLFEDEPRAAVLTPRRWHRDFLTRPGAW